jgi:hypothetical protein
MAVDGMDFIIGALRENCQGIQRGIYEIQAETVKVPPDVCERSFDGSQILNAITVFYVSDSTPSSDFGRNMIY